MLLQISPEVGETWVPCVFDDGDLADQRPRVLKAFFDPTQVESNVYVRWGAAKFKRNQARFGGDNESDADAEPTQTDWHLASTSPDKEKRTTAYLVDMIKPAFPKNLSLSNIGAMLKRCNIKLNTKHNVYFRPCGTVALVEKLPLMDGYITPEAGKCLQNFLRNNVKRNQEEFDALLAFEKRDMLKLMAEAKKEFKEDGGDATEQPAREPAQPAAPANPDDAEIDAAAQEMQADQSEEDAAAQEMQADQSEEDVFNFGGDMDASRQEAPGTPPSAVVKAEPGVWKRKLMTGHAVIDLYTPSPKHPRTDLKSRRKDENDKLDRLVDEFASAMHGGAAASSASGL